MSFFEKLKQGLTKTKEAITGKVNEVFSNFRKVDEELLEELEEALILSDVGADTSIKIVDNLRKRIKLEKIEDAEKVKDVLKEEIYNILSNKDNSLNLSTKPSVMLVVGVNGAGKTTSIGKIAANLKASRKESFSCCCGYF